LLSDLALQAGRFVEVGVELFGEAFHLLSYRLAVVFDLKGA
jgi:hypothetical protein